MSEPYQIPALVASPTEFRRAAVAAGWSPLPVTGKAPAAGIPWKTVVATEAEIASWGARTDAPATGVRLGRTVRLGTTRRGDTDLCQAGDAVGIDFDLDDPADRVIVDAVVRHLAADGVRGSLLTVGRADGGRTSRVKILLRAAEDFPGGESFTKTVHYQGHVVGGVHRSIECYVAGRQFVVHGPHAHAGCMLEIRLDGAVVPVLPPLSTTASIDVRQWRGLLAFIDKGCGLGLVRSMSEQKLKGDRWGLDGDFVVLVDPATDRITDGRESAITHACYAVHGRVMDDKRVPLAGLEDPGSRHLLLVETAWQLINRDVDLTRPRDGGSGSETFWTRDHVEERMLRVQRSNDEHHLEERRRIESVTPNLLERSYLPFPDLVRTLLDGWSPLIDRAASERAREIERRTAEAEILRAADDRRAAALVTNDGTVVLADDPLVFGFVDAGNVSVLWGDSGVGKTTLVGSWGFMAAAGMFRDPNRLPSLVAPADPSLGSLTHFDPDSTHVLVACEGHRVIERAKRGVEHAIALARDPGATEIERIPEIDVPDWWSHYLPRWCLDETGTGWRRGAEPRRWLRLYGTDAVPGFVVLDVEAAVALFPAELMHGSALVVRERFATSINAALADLVRGVVAASAARPAGTPCKPVVTVDNLLSICPEAEDHTAVSRLYGVLRSIASTTGAGILLLHHATKVGDTYAGSASVLRYSSIAVEMIVDPENPWSRLFWHRKLRYGFPVPHRFSASAFARFPMFPTERVVLASSAMRNAAFVAAFERTLDGGAVYGHLQTMPERWGRDGPNDVTVSSELRSIFTARDRAKAARESKMRNLEILRPDFAPKAHGGTGSAPLREWPLMPALRAVEAETAPPAWSAIESAFPLMPGAVPAPAAVPLPAASPAPAVPLPAASPAPAAPPVSFMSTMLPGDLLFAVMGADDPIDDDDPVVERGLAPVAGDAIEMLIHFDLAYSPIEGIVWTDPDKRERPAPKPRPPTLKAEPDMTPLDRAPGVVITEELRPMMVRLATEAAEVMRENAERFARAHRAMMNAPPRVPYPITATRPPASRFDRLYTAPRAPPRAPLPSASLREEEIPF